MLKTFLICSLLALVQCRTKTVNDEAADDSKPHPLFYTFFAGSLIDDAMERLKFTEAERDELNNLKENYFYSNSMEVLETFEKHNKGTYQRFVELEKALTEIAEKLSSKARRVLEKMVHARAHAIMDYYYVVLAEGFTKELTTSTTKKNQAVKKELIEGFMLKTETSGTDNRENPAKSSAGAVDTVKTH